MSNTSGHTPIGQWGEEEGLDEEVEGYGDWDDKPAKEEKVRRESGDEKVGRIKGKVYRAQITRDISDLDDYALYSSGDVAKVARVQVQTITQAARRGKLIPKQRAGKFYLFEGREVKRWDADRKPGPGSVTGGWKPGL